MKKIILITVLFLVAAVAKLSAQEKGSYKSLLDWSYWQSEPAKYEMTVQSNSELSNQNVFSIKSVQSKIYKFGTLMNTIKSDDYKGKTVKMTGYIKSDNVKNWAGLWMRVDYYRTDVLAFDNMQNRGIKRTKDWTKYEVVLFVPQEATSISYGVLLSGTGQIWFKDVKLEIVDESVAETGQNKGRDHKVISFEKRAKAIANEIKKITDEEKNALKAEIETIDKDFANTFITKEKADELKLQKAHVRAAAIETKVSAEQEKLNQLVQDKVDGKVLAEKDNRSGGRSIIMGNNTDEIGERQTEINITSMKVYNGQEDKEERQSKRTTSQLVLATGVNNLVTNSSVNKSDFRYVGSHFYEWGLTYNTRISNDHNLLHAKYGLSVMYNNLRPTNNRFFETNGDQTILQTNASNPAYNSVRIDDARLRNVYLVAPLHLEFDFSGKTVKEDRTYFKTHQSWRLGIGGYVGTRLKTKQILQYQVDNHEVTDKYKGGYNTTDFIYGLSSYVGYGATSLYLKYDLNPVFKNNPVKQNNVSLGVRFDFN
ncbi:MAG: succinate dehydrogenase flavin-adding protein (antitoxin of CptAB toxin-antitoxin module) [Flavobacteriales bacterium]|jgi:succinate dehydrogenase flavin-adding protein (antitoxin of CptAB toxin-antitoxin module)